MRTNHQMNSASSLERESLLLPPLTNRSPNHCNRYVAVNVVDRPYFSHTIGGTDRRRATNQSKRDQR